MLLRLPRSIFVLFRVLSFAVGDIYILELIFDHTLGHILTDGGEQPWNESFEKNGKSL